MTFTANNGCTYCGSDSHMQSVCPWKRIKEISDSLDDFTDKAMTAIREGKVDKFLGIAAVDDQPQASAAHSAPAGEREAFEAAVAAVNERGWTTSTDLARQIWDSCAAWQRAQSAPVVPEGLNKTREQWQKVDAKQCANSNSSAANFYLIRDAQQDIERLHRALAAAPQPAAHGEAVYQIQYLGDGGGGWCDVEKSEHDSYSAQQDYRTRTLYAHATAARQEQGDEVRGLREALELARPCVIRDMEAAVRENFGRVGNDPWACAAVDARDAIDAALSASAEGGVR